MKLSILAAKIGSRLSSPLSFQGNDKILVESYENTRKDQTRMRSISLEISGKVRISSWLLLVHGCSNSSEILRVKVNAS